MQYRKEEKNNRGFSLVELIIVIAIMAILIGVLTSMYLSHMHRVKVTTDWANLKNYFTEIQADYISTGEYNPNVPTTHRTAEDYMQREIHFLSGQTVKMKDGYFAVTKEAQGNGYHLVYYCNECLSDWDKHKDTCILEITP